MESAFLLPSAAAAFCDTAHGLTDEETTADEDANLSVPPSAAHRTDQQLTAAQGIGIIHPITDQMTATRAHALSHHEKFESEPEHQLPAESGESVPASSEPADENLSTVVAVSTPIADQAAEEQLPTSDQAADEAADAAAQDIKRRARKDYAERIAAALHKALGPMHRDLEHQNAAFDQMNRRSQCFLHSGQSTNEE